MSQNGQTHFKNLAAFVVRFLKCVCDHFGTLCMKGLKNFLKEKKGFYHSLGYLLIAHSVAITLKE